MPPLGVTVAVPFEPPFPDTPVIDSAAFKADAGWLTVTLSVSWTELLLVTVTEYVPAISPEALAPVPPDGAHEYVYGPVPAATLAVAVPLIPP